MARASIPGQAAGKESIMKLTIYDIAKQNKEGGYNFFSRGTLNFFNQRLRDYRVYYRGSRIFAFCPKGRAEFAGQPVKGQFTLAEFYPVTGKTSSVPGIHTITDAYKFLKIRGRLCD